MSGRALPQLSEYDEIVGYSCSWRGPGVEDETDPPPGPPGIRTTRYEVWLYANVMEALPPGSVPPSQRRAAPPAEIAGLPLAGHEEIAIHWRTYAEYLANLSAGEEGLRRLQAFLRESFSPSLQRLVEAPPGPLRLRIWWLNEAPELEDVPWESIALGQRRSTRISIVRGSPPASVPPLPLPPGQPLTVAVFDPAGLAPEPLRDALGDPGPGVTVVRLEAGDPHAALSEAAGKGVEVVHLVADGSVPLGLEGQLDFPAGATLTPAAVGHLLRGSRVAVLSLSAPAAPHAGRDGWPSVFHGFARFGRWMGDGLSVVAPLGPVAPPELTRFWRTFYARFAGSLDVEDALVEATPCPLRAPFVLFLRHRFGRQFWRPGDEDQDDLVSFEPGGDGPSASPAQASADLAVSGDLLDATAALQKRYAALGLPFPSEDLVDEERRRQRALAAYLEGALSRRSER